MSEHCLTFGFLLADGLDNWQLLPWVYKEPGILSFGWLFAGFSFVWEAA